MKNNDRKILESLITKYGKSRVNLAINRLNENNENPKSGIFIESHDHLNCDAFRILVLDNGVNVLKNDPLEIECEGQYSAKRYIEKLEPKYGNDYIEVNYVGNLWEKSLCLINVVKALNMKYPELPIYCFTMGWNTWKGEYENVQKFFNDIFSKYLRGLAFEFIPGTMGEFLKNDMNESLNENNINENTELKRNIQEFFKANDSQFEEFRKDLFKYGFGMVSSFFYTGRNEVKLIFESKFIDNYFAHQPNEYKVTVCVGSMKSPDVEILRVQTRNGLTKQVLYDAIEKFLIEEFGEINEPLNENFGQTINGVQNTTLEDYERYWNVNIEVVYFNKDNNKCAIYMWLPEDENVNEIPEALLEDGIVFERNGMNYWFEPNPSDCYLTYNGTCISLGGYAYPEY